MTDLTVAQSKMAKAMKESALQEQVRVLCKDLGLLYYHTFRSQYSPAGYPDCTIVGPTDMIYAELKQVGKVPTDEQQKWIDGLRRVGHTVYVWDPRHLYSKEIADVLIALARREPFGATQAASP